MIAKVRRLATSRLSFSTSTDMKPYKIALPRPPPSPDRGGKTAGKPANLARRVARSGSGLAADLGQPPAQADEQEAPVLHELGWLAFVGVADELEDPADHEQRHGQRPQP